MKYSVSNPSGTEGEGENSIFAILFRKNEGRTHLEIALQGLK